VSTQGVAQFKKRRKGEQITQTTQHRGEPSRKRREQLFPAQEKKRSPARPRKNMHTLGHKSPSLGPETITTQKPARGRPFTPQPRCTQTSHGAGPKPTQSPGNRRPHLSNEITWAATKTRSASHLRWGSEISVSRRLVRRLQGSSRGGPAGPLSLLQTNLGLHE